MFEFNTYVNANEIWPNAKVEIDLGHKECYLRGYNIEVIQDGVPVWLSCTYISVNPQAYFNSDFYLWYYKEHNFKPTGRICFRGYAVQRWNAEVGDYVEPVHFNKETLAFLKSQLSSENSIRLDKHTAIMLENDDYIDYDIDALCISYIIQNFNVKVHK